VKLAKAQGLVVHRIATGWDDNLAPAEVEKLLSEHPEIRGFAMAYGDTSTAVANDVAGVARVTRARDVMLLVDGVSSIGGMPFAFDEWGVDVALTASQKCLMSSPGISFAVLSERARARQTSATLVHTYWDFAEIHKDVTKRKPEPPGTPPIHCVMQVGEALRMIHEEGLSAVYQRHAEMASMTHAAIAELGLRHQCPSLTARSTTVTAIALPPEHPPARVRDALKARGFLTAGALEHFQPTAFRIGHMGDIRPDDLSSALDALRAVLHE
jgi:aspartate aminotransferase-like enzyme